MGIIKNLKNLPKPKWQTVDYAADQELRFHLPTAFLMLCRLWDTTPREILTDFMDNLSQGHHNRQHHKKAKKHLRRYILEMAYGQQQYYNVADLKQMFAELDTIGSLWPNGASPKMLGLHERWQKKYYGWWFKKWHGPPRRRCPKKRRRNREEYKNHRCIFEASGNVVNPHPTGRSIFTIFSR